MSQWFCHSFLFLSKATKTSHRNSWPLDTPPHLVCPTLAASAHTQPVHCEKPQRETIRPAKLTSRTSDVSCPMWLWLHSGFLGGSCILPSGCQARVGSPQAKGATYKDKGNLKLPAVAATCRTIKGGPRGEAGEGSHLSSRSPGHSLSFQDIETSMSLRQRRKPRTRGRGV